MNKRERVITALKGGEPDRVPAGFWFHFGGEAAKGQARSTHTSTTLKSATST